MPKQIIRTKRSRVEILKDLNKLVRSPGYIYVLAEISSLDFFVDTHNLANINWGNRLHVNEFGLLVGLLLKIENADTDEPSESDIQKTIKITRSLLEELHRMYAYSFIKIKDTAPIKSSMSSRENDLRNIFGARDPIVESTFYGDMGVYDMQCFELAGKLYSNDEDWISKNTNFNLKYAESIFLGLEDAINSLHHARIHEDVLYKFVGKKRVEAEGKLRAIDEMAFPLKLILSSAKKHNSDITRKNVKDFLDLFSCQTGQQLATFNEPGDENIFSYKPFIKLGEDIYFLPNKMYLALAIYKSPLYWMRQDEKYLNTVNKNIGNIAEKITYDYFVNIFDKHNVYTDIDIYKGKNRVTDIDVMAVVGNTAIIAQNKNKKMTIEALSGDVDAIKHDFQKAIIEPYEQGIKVRDVILGDEPYKLKERSGKQILLPDGIKHAYILCVTTEPYPAALTQIKTFLEEVNQPPPIQLSIFDLDLMAQYLADPYEFAFYIKQRVELDDKMVADDEIALLAFHIKYGLFLPEGATHFSPDRSFAQLIDADYYHRKKGTQAPKKSDSLARSWSNKHFEKIIHHIKQIDDPSKTDIIFFLMTLPEAYVKAVMIYIERINIVAGKDNEFHDFTIPIILNDKPWGGISYVIGSSFEGVASRLEAISSMNKYRSHADQWLSIGASSDGVLQIIRFEKFVWKQVKDTDDALERYTKNTNGRKASIEENPWG